MDPLAKRVAARFQASQSKRAFLTDGPIGRVLNKVWNNVHDIEYDLEQTLKDYDDAAHFMGGPAEHDAKEMIKKIQAAVKDLEKVSKSTFNDLADAESAFVKKYGEPSDYADQMRKKTFPRAAAGPRAIHVTAAANPAFKWGSFATACDVAGKELHTLAKEADEARREGGEHKEDIQKIFEAVKKAQLEVDHAVVLANTLASKLKRK